MAQFERYKAGTKDWRWRLRSANGEIVAEANQQYPTKKAVLDGVKAVVVNVVQASDRTTGGDPLVVDVED